MSGQGDMRTLARTVINFAAKPDGGQPVPLTDKPDHRRVVAGLCQIMQQSEWRTLYVEDWAAHLVEWHAGVPPGVAQQCAAKINLNTGRRYQMSEYMSVV